MKNMLPSQVTDNNSVCSTLRRFFIGYTFQLMIKILAYAVAMYYLPQMLRPYVGIPFQISRTIFAFLREKIEIKLQ